MENGFEGGFLYCGNGIGVLDLHGTWHQMGRQYGALAKPYLLHVLEYLDGKLGALTAKAAEADLIAGKLYANYPDYLKDFFAGMAETSGLSLQRLRLCNAVEYVEGCFLCSAMAAWDEWSPGGKLVFGRNYDAVNYREIDSDVLVTVYRPVGGTPAATVGYAGEIYCVNGINANGLFIELNNGMPSAGTEIYWDLCPGTTLLFEQLFQARSLDDLDDFFTANRSSTAFIISVADGRQARSYEWCHDGVRRGDGATAPGLMISTNHYVNGDWPYAVPTDADSWNSLTRRCNLQACAISHKGAMGVEEMKAIMSASLSEGGPLHEFTRYHIVAVPEDMTLHVKVPGRTGWVEFQMSKYFKNEIG